VVEAMSDDRGLQVGLQWARAVIENTLPPYPVGGFSPASDDAAAILRDLLAGADDHRCWWVPDEIAGRARKLLNRDEPNV
jgi:hypothetical protein